LGASISNIIVGSAQNVSVLGFFFIAKRWFLQQTVSIGELSSMNGGICICPWQAKKYSSLCCFIFATATKFRIRAWIIYALLSVFCLIPLLLEGDFHFSAAVNCS
jgi:hypothetical protein